MNFDNKLLGQTALYLRKHGSPHLRSLSISALEKTLTGFVIDHYYLLAGETFLESFHDSYEAHVSERTKGDFAAAIATSDLFVEPRMTTVFPLVPVEVRSGFTSTPFFLVPPSELPPELQGAFSGALDPNSFPPVTDWEGRRHVPTSWLGVRTPTLEAGKQMRAAVLGAIALLPHHLERYMFSGRSQFGGYTSFDGRWTLSMGDPHTPPLMTNIVIDREDHGWLSELAKKVSSPVKADRRQMRALEYYYRAWAPDPVKRFPTLFAAIDAIFGDASAATQAVVDAISPIMGGAYTKERIRLMLGLRASVVHGGAPNVYESSKYEAYYRAYETDAVRDLELIVARCLQSVIFPTIFRERPHTHADLIKRETGRDV